MGGANWKDERIPVVYNQPSSSLPPDVKAKLRFAQVPLLQFEGKRLVQARAIGRFLARQFNLDGKDVYESAECDEIVDACLELNGAFWHLAMENAPEKKAEGFARTLANTKEAYFSELNRTLKANGEFLVGNGLTWADICVAHFVDNIQTIFSVDIVREFPELKGHIEMVYSLAGIKEWIQKRPDKILKCILYFPLEGSYTRLSNIIIL